MPHETPSPPEINQEQAIAIVRDYERRRFERTMAKSQSEISPSVVLGQEATFIQTTATQETLDRYNRRGHQLFHRFLRESGIAHEGITPASSGAGEFVRWAFALKATLKPATWRMYRASLHHYLEQYAHAGSSVTDAQDELARDAAIRSLDSASGRKSSAGDTRSGSSRLFSSSLKMKKITHPDLQRLLAWLRVKSRSQWAQATSTWISAGILCGLRPSEWELTMLKTVPDATKKSGQSVWLFIICAKATNGRGFSVSRTLDLSDFDTASLNCVSEMVHRAQTWREEGTFLENQNSCAQLLYNANRALWPTRKRSISLYSARHQAIANWKHLGMSKAAISVLSGHASLMTAGESYGRRTAGWNGVAVAPSPVKEELDLALSRERDIEMRKAFVKKSTPAPRPLPAPEPTPAPAPTPPSPRRDAPGL